MELSPKHVEVPQVLDHAAMLRPRHRARRGGPLNFGLHQQKEGLKPEEGGKRTDLSRSKRFGLRYVLLLPCADMQSIPRDILIDLKYLEA